MIGRQLRFCFFQSVFVQEDTSSVPNFPDMVENEVVLADIEISYEEVLAELRTLKLDNDAGPDGIPTSILNKCAEQLAQPLFILFRKTLI